MGYNDGSDVSIWPVAVCVMDATGKRIFERATACEVEEIQACLCDVLPGRCRIGFESGALI